MKHTYIITEAGVNHNGSMELAKQLIDVAAEAGADVVKFQTFNAEKLVSKSASKADYQLQTTDKSETQFEMLKKLELKVENHNELINYCKQKGIAFLSTAFDTDSVELLNQLGLDTFKIPSGEITNLPYLQKIGSLRKKVILSTGMSNLEEIGDALKVIVEAGTPKEMIIVLHCTTEYPTPMEEVNLSAMLTIRDTFKVSVGYSDHSPGIEVATAAVALGATVIEKHFTLDKNMQGPDHKASLEPDELKAMIKAIRNIEKAMGDGVKTPTPSEIKNKPIARKSIHLAKTLQAGHVLSADDLTMKRPGTGISPMEINSVIGKKLTNNFLADHLLKLGDIQ